MSSPAPTAIAAAGLEEALRNALQAYADLRPDGSHPSPDGCLRVATGAAFALRMRDRALPAAEPGDPLRQDAIAVALVQALQQSLLIVASGTGEDAPLLLTQGELAAVLGMPELVAWRQLAARA